jgi:hypothetical protein
MTDVKKYYVLDGGERVHALRGVDLNFSSEYYSIREGEFVMVRHLSPAPTLAAQYYLHHCATAPLHHCATAPLRHCATAPLHAPLHHCTHHCITASHARARIGGRIASGGALTTDHPQKLLQQFLREGELGEETG